MMSAHNRMAVTRRCVCLFIVHLIFIGTQIMPVVADEQSVPTNRDAEAISEVFEFTSYVAIDELFTALDYTDASWMAGIHTVPRAYLAEIPERWAKIHSKEISVSDKKRLFFRVLAPSILLSNELLLDDREKLLQIADALEQGSEPSESQQIWLDDIAAYYGLGQGEGDQLKSLIVELKNRVDIVPLSLVLSQAAEESGWGTSRFAFTGNALFGQWTWGDGIKPEQQRAGRGDYRIAAFASPLQSIQAHSRNLNTHTAYAEFRTLRAQLRNNGDVLSGQVLAGALSRYSERGEDYIRSLRAIIRINALAEADEAILDDRPPIILVPVDG